MKIVITSVIMTLIVFSCTNTKSRTNTSNAGIVTTYNTTGKIERLNDALNSILAENAQIEILAEGFSWSEGPVWITEGDYLIFSDIPNNKIFKWKEGDGLSVYLEPSGYNGSEHYSKEPGSNGLAIGSDGKLLLCQHGNRQVGKMDANLSEPKAEFITIASEYMGKKFNSPNDLAEHKNGTIYFTDPPYGMPNRENSELKELDVFGVYKVDTSAVVTLLVDNLTRPNGIAFNPDFSVCYVTQSDPEKAVIMAYDLSDDGTFRNERIFFDATSMVAEKKGLPDGLKVHPKNGYIFSTGPGGVLVFSPEGDHLGTINTGQATANCAFDADFNYLYMTANNYLMRIKLIKLK